MDLDVLVARVRELEGGLKAIVDHGALYSDSDWNYYCHFCGLRDMHGHEPDCLYERLVALVGDPPA